MNSSRSSLSVVALAAVLTAFSSMPMLPAQAVGSGGSAQPSLAIPTLPSLPRNSLDSSQISPVTPDTYVIGPNDLVAIVVLQMPDLTQQVRVGSGGDIRLPLMSRSLQAAGLTPPELQRSVGTELVREGLSRDPAVQVSVLQVDSKPIVVGGAIIHALTLQAARPMSLMEVLSQAGGPSQAAGDTILVSSTDNPNADPKSYSLHALMNHEPNANPLLTGNQMVTIMSARLIYVVGDFNQPGAFPLISGQPVTVLNAIALAKGMSDSPNRGQAQIIHTGEDGVRQVKPLDIGRILKQQAPDPALQAGDILYVPEDVRRQVLVSALKDAAQVLTLGAAYRFP